MKNNKFLLAALVIILLLSGILFLLFTLNKHKRNSAMIYGISFNSEYAYYLGLDNKAVFNKILNEWNFKYIRLSAQWNAIEKNKGQYDWQDLDWLMDAAAAKNAKVMLAVGHKTPRWPECHTPQWADKSNPEQLKKDLQNFIKLVIERYQHHPALEIWQVENEPFLNFGNCEPISLDDLKEEVGWVKQADADHPIIVTDSGELSFWRKTARTADLFGTTLYRVVWNKIIGYWSYDWIMPAFVYKAKLWFNNRDINTAYITELQAEPWIPDKALVDTPLAEQFKSMDLKRLQKNIIFADKTGMPRAYLWGAEWWYWLETKGQTDIPEYIQGLKKE
jgi:hypothetical protein